MNVREREGRGTQALASDVDPVLIEPNDQSVVERGRSHQPLFRLGTGLDLLVHTPAGFERLRRERNPVIDRVEE